MFVNSGGNISRNTVKEAMNFLSSTNSGTSGDEGKGDSDVRRAIKGDGYHRIWDAWYSEFEIMIPCNKGIIERRSVHRDMCESVLWEVLLETSQQEIVVEVGGEVERWHHLGSDEGEVVCKTHTVTGDIPVNDWMSKG
jgi:hypothetical protein